MMATTNSIIDNLGETAKDEAIGSLPVRKRKSNGDNDGLDDKKVKADPDGYAAVAATAGGGADEDSDLKPLKRSQPMSKAREVRLEQNRKAARESRRRKKVLIEELQRSVIFFSRANGTLKQQNEELQRMLTQAKSQVQVIESGQGQARPQVQMAAMQQPLPPAIKQEMEQSIRQEIQPQQPAGDNKDQANLQALAAVQAQASLQQLQNQSGGMPLDGNMMANWMNFQAAMTGGAMGMDPNSVYAQALNQFALQQAAAAQNQVQAPVNQMQFPFGMAAAQMGMLQAPFPAANPFQLQQFAAAAANPASAAQWQAAQNSQNQGASPNHPAN